VGNTVGDKVGDKDGSDVGANDGPMDGKNVGYDVVGANEVLVGIVGAMVLATIGAGVGMVGLEAFVGDGAGVGEVVGLDEGSCSREPARVPLFAVGEPTKVVESADDEEFVDGLESPKFVENRSNLAC